MDQVYPSGAQIIGSRLRKARLAMGISMESLSELAELDTTTIGKIERGMNSPTVETLVRISCALNVNQSDIISGLTAKNFKDKHHQLSVKDLIKAQRTRR